MLKNASQTQTEATFPMCECANYLFNSEASIPLNTSKQPFPQLAPTLPYPLFFFFLFFS